jgi:hypothetical protein
MLAQVKKEDQSNWSKDGFGGLVVSMLASGSRVHGFKPDFGAYKKSQLLR